MLTRLLSLCFAAGLAFPALAQNGPAASGFMTEPPVGSTRLSSIIGVGVIGSDITRLGEVKDVTIGPDGRIAAVIIDVGGFLGIGEKRVAVPFGDLLWNYNVDPTTGPSSSTTGGPPVQGGGFDMKRADTTAPGPEASDVTGTVGNPDAPQEGLQPKGATVPVVGKGSLRHAVLRMTREDVEKLPEIRDRR